MNLCRLDLSSNHLSSISELVVLVALEYLDLSDNNVSQLGKLQGGHCSTKCNIHYCIEGLQKIENLSRLELAGNKISR